MPPQEISFDARSYAKYVLQEGEAAEKQELLEMFRDKLILKNKALSVIPAEAGIQYT